MPLRSSGICLKREGLNSRNHETDVLPLLRLVKCFSGERYCAVVNDLGRLSKTHVAYATEQIRKLVGEIRLVPMAEGYLDAVLSGRYERVLKLALGGKLNNLVAGERFYRHFRLPCALP
jgi:hypothetical protein